MERAPWQITRVSKAGLAFIKENEGFRLTVYADVGTNGTVGWGHRTILKVGTLISTAQAESFFERDIKTVEMCINHSVSVDLTQDQYDAIADFVFNVGCSAFRNSRLLHYLNSGDLKAIPQQLMLWVNAAGHRVKGLEERRKREVELFNGH